MKEIVEEIKIDLPWSELLVVKTQTPSKIKNVNDDKQREAEL
jgi:hypothetical protein